MSADARAERDCIPAFGLGEALYFDTSDHRLFGWLHRPSSETYGMTADIGLVVCKPFGYEAICSHRSVRAFAEAAAALGVPSLRFDYLGTGDSADIDPMADQLAVWTQDVAAAVAELKRLTGVKRVCLLGFRFGALLAILAAAKCKPVDALILIAPVISGRRYLRELRTTRVAATLSARCADSVISATPDPHTQSVTAIEVSGFPLSAATLAALAQVDLMPLDAPRISAMLIIDSGSLPAARPWAEKLSSLGARVDYIVLPGLIEMLMTQPELAIIPQAMIEKMREWLLRFEPGLSARPEVGDHQFESVAVTSKTTLSMPAADSAPRALLTEQPVFIASEAMLFGIITEPHHSDKRRRAVVLLNVGAEHHIGSSRMYVSLARRWARHGYTVLRLDLAGLGDSGTQPGQQQNEAFPVRALDDIRAAIEFMRSQYSAVDITLGGLCSGAYHALRAAVVGLPVTRILVINPMNFFWAEGITAYEIQRSVDVARNLSFYRERLFSATIWRRILTGELNIWRILRILIHRPLLALESALRDLARHLRFRLPHDLGWELEEIGARGVKVVFVFSRGEPGLDLLKLHAGSSVRRLGNECHVHVIDGADHIFSQSAPRALLERILSDEVLT